MGTCTEFDRLCVVLVATRNPLNIGAAARAMSNFGFSALRLVNPYGPSFREARSAVGASRLLAAAEVYESVADAVADCGLVVGTTAAHRRELQHPVKPLTVSAELVQRQLAAGRVALLFGSEKRGLSNDDLSRCHWLLRIPTRPEHGSMNLGQAVAVCLYELSRTASAPPTESQPVHAAAAAGLDRITAAMFQALSASGYVKPGAESATEEKVRRMVRRLNFSAGDAELWLGMLRKITLKLQSQTRQEPRAPFSTKPESTRRTKPK